MKRVPPAISYEDRLAYGAMPAYGAACHAAGRAESGNREPTDATESEAFCALKNRLTDLLNSHGHYREMTAYQGALERYREAVASEARRRERLRAKPKHGRIRP